MKGALSLFSNKFQSKASVWRGCSGKGWLGFCGHHGYPLRSTTSADPLGRTGLIRNLGTLLHHHQVCCPGPASIHPFVGGREIGIIADGVNFAGRIEGRMYPFRIRRLETKGGTEAATTRHAQLMGGVFFSEGKAFQVCTMCPTHSKHD